MKDFSLGNTDFRALPATSAPSHICKTWRNVAQMCFIMKEMGPERPRTILADPIWDYFEPYQVTSVQHRCCLQKWGRSRTDPISGRKWGRSRADPILLSSLIGRANRKSIANSTPKPATCGRMISLGFHNHSETKNRRCGPLILKAGPRRWKIFWLRCAQSETHSISYSSAWRPRIAHTAF